MIQNLKHFHRALLWFNVLGHLFPKKIMTKHRENTKCTFTGHPRQYIVFIVTWLSFIWAGLQACHRHERRKSKTYQVFCRPNMKEGRQKHIGLGCKLNY